MEFTTTKEFILQAHKSACTEWKLKIEKEFPEAFKKELEVGKWYYNQEYDIVFYLTEYKYDDVFNGYGFDKDKEWFSCDKSVNILAKYCNREATDKEVEKALIAEAKKRFGDDWENTKIKECLYIGGYIGNSGLNIPAISVCYNRIWNQNALIFKNGIWAEPLIEEKTTISKAKALKIIAKKLKVSPENIIIE